MSLTCEQPDIDGLLIHDGPELVAEIRSLRMVLARFRPGGTPFLGPTVPLPLFWMQYANHEDPNRNAGSNAVLKVLKRGPDKITIECSGTTASGSCRSLFVLTITRMVPEVRYRYTIAARLDVVSKTGWLVTPNPDHGEIEFANLWPEGAFVTNPDLKKRFQACYLVGKDKILRIPHHHLESSDKHLIPLLPGDRFLWALEEENPCLTLKSEHTVTAGVCAYMWDAHFAYKVADPDKPVILPPGTTFEAVYVLSGVDRPEAEGIVSVAQDRPAAGRGPMYVDGVNRFSEILEPPWIGGESAWPWEKEGEVGAVLSVDNRRGFDDTASLCIDRTTDGRSSWKATALGPAYGKPPFPDGARFCLSALVTTDHLAGEASIALRLHREGKGSVFEPGNYELFESVTRLTATNGWVRLEVVTPPISPAPDRLHLLLVQRGPGRTWFDNAQLEVLR